MLVPDSPQGTLLSQMFPGYAAVYFTGGTCEARRGEVQVTDTVYRNSPAPKTPILRHPSPSAPRNPEPGLAELDLGPDTASPLPQQCFSVAPFEEVPVLIPRPGGLPHPADPQAQGSGHKHHTLSTSCMRSGYQAASVLWVAVPRGVALSGPPSSKRVELGEVLPSAPAPAVGCVSDTWQPVNHSQPSCCLLKFQLKVFPLNPYHLADASRIEKR